jgi:hypothetical protein
VTALRSWRRIAVLAFLASLLTASPASSAADAEGEPYAVLYGKLLESHTASVEATVGTVVDYRRLLQDPAAGQWRRLLRALEAAPPPATRGQALALWINAYNILAIDMVLRHYPVESIRDIGSLWRPVWKHDAGNAANRAVSLHEVEHEILRPMGDPRIHAAIVCASTSCPSLWRRPYSASHIEEELDDAMRRFLANSEKGLQIDLAKQRMRVSQIFKWFAEDFDALGGVAASIRRHAPETPRRWLETSGRNATIDYLEYDWSLNEPS